MFSDSHITQDVRNVPNVKFAQPKNIFNVHTGIISINLSNTYELVVDNATSQGFAALKTTGYGFLLVKINTMSGMSKI